MPLSCSIPLVPPYLTGLELKAIDDARFGETYD